MPKWSITATLENLMPNTKNNASKSVKLPNENFFTAGSFFNIPNLTYLAF